MADSIMKHGGRYKETGTEQKEKGYFVIYCKDRMCGIVSL